MTLLFNLITRGTLLLSKVHVLFHGLQYLVKGIAWVLHSNVGLLGLDRLINAIWP